MTAASAEPARGKVQYFEWARAFGALGIVLLHVFICIARGVPDPGIGTGRLVAYRELGMVLSRWCVPVFLMISGALLLDPAKEVGLAKLRRYVGRMLFVICSFGFVFALMQEYVDIGPGWEMVLVAARDVVFQQSWDHLWYVYAMVGLYAVTPVLRAFTAHASREEFRWVLGFALGFSLAVPTLNALLGWNLTTFFLGFSSCFAYYLLGWYAHAYLRYSWKWGVGALVCVAAMAALTAWGTTRGLAQTGQVYAPESPLVLVYALAIFLALRRFLDAVPIASCPPLAAVARYSFGIYIIHPLFGHVALLFANPLDYPVGAFELVLFAVSVVGSIAITWLLKHLPGFRRAL